MIQMVNPKLGTVQLFIMILILRVSKNIIMEKTMASGHFILIMEIFKHRVGLLMVQKMGNGNIFMKLARFGN